MESIVLVQQEMKTIENQIKILLLNINRMEDYYFNI